jgi:crossover junction endodeoxyribonuclease RuvC
MGKVIIGIDPGLEGAVVALYLDGGARVRMADTPNVRTSDARGRERRVYDEAEMARVLRGMACSIEGGDLPEVHAFIEQVHAMPKQGVASSFTFGMGYGIWLGILAALRIPHTRVTPQRWVKAVAADAPKTDQAMVALAGRLYPGVSEDLRTPRGRLLLGRSDALLLAHYGRVSGALPGP